MHFNAYLSLLMAFAGSSIANTCHGTTSGAPPAGATKVQLGAAVGATAAFNGAGCNLQFTATDDRIACIADITGLATCAAKYKIYLRYQGVFRTIAGGSNPDCASDQYDCAQGIFVSDAPTTAAPGGGAAGGGGGAGGAPAPGTPGGPLPAPGGPGSSTDDNDPSKPCTPFAADGSCPGGDCDDCCSRDDGCS